MQPRLRSGTGLILVGCLLVPIGCGLRKEDRIEQPAYSPEEAARRALDEYDSNKDGFIAGAELDRCPALKGSLDQLDTNKDGKLSADEIAQRLRDYQSSKIALLTVTCQVTLDDRPLSGATVTFVPEPFMGPALKAAAGVTDAAGIAELAIPGQPYPGVHLGFYRIAVSLKNADGMETLPARYQRTTELGQEVGPSVPGLIGGVNLALISGAAAPE